MRAIILILQSFILEEKYLWSFQVLEKPIFENVMLFLYIDHVCILPILCLGF